MAHRSRNRIPAARGVHARPPSLLLQPPDGEPEWYIPEPEPERVRIAPIPGPGRHRQDALDEPQERPGSRWWLALHLVTAALWAAVLVVLAGRLLAIYLRLPGNP